MFKKNKNQADCTCHLSNNNSNLKENVLCLKQRLSP